MVEKYLFPVSLAVHSGLKCAKDAREVVLSIKFCVDAVSLGFCEKVVFGIALVFPIRRDEKQVSKKLVPNDRELRIPGPGTILAFMRSG